MLVAFPTNAPGGLDATISEHFGHCDAFTLVEVDEGKAGEVRILPNDTHQEGACMAPVNLLNDQGVNALISGGMGGRPLQGFQEVGIKVYFHEHAETVNQALEKLAASELREFGPAQTCASNCSGHEDDPQHHGHVQIERPPIDGKADVRNDRVVGFNYTLRDGDSGQILDSNEGRPPFRYLHGRDQIVPGLEKALEGLLAGANARVRIAPEEAYGCHDPEAVIEVPKKAVPDDVQVGMMLEMRTKDGRTKPVIVVEIGAEQVKLDGNHPFADKTLDFEVSIANVQAAAPEELSAGRVLG